MPPILPLTPEQYKWFVEYAGLIVAAPFLAGFLIIMGLRASKTPSMAVSVGSVLYGLFHSIAIFQAFETKSYPAPLFQQNFDWFVSSQFSFSMGVLVDNLAAVMLIVVCAVSLLVQIYPWVYAGRYRLFALLRIFIFIYRLNARSGDFNQSI